MATSEEKKEGTSIKDKQAKGTGEKLQTDMPLSEKDEVKRAEHNVNKSAAKSK